MRLCWRNLSVADSPTSVILFNPLVHDSNSAPKWKNLENPVLSYDDWSIGDFACAYRDRSFHLFISVFHEHDGELRSQIVEVRTPDFVTYSEPLLRIDGAGRGWRGVCSPSITKVDGSYYLTVNSWGNGSGEPDQLFYRRSENLLNWTPVSPLAADLTAGRRATDAAIARDGSRFYLVYKEDGVPRIAVGDSVEGDFEGLGDDTGSTTQAVGARNYQFIQVDGRWRLQATHADRDHSPVIYTMQGSGAHDADWLRWGDGRTLEVPKEPFNAAERANASYLLDRREYDGFFYLLYAGNAGKSSFGRRGLNRLGIARSRDLVHWVAAGRAQYHRE